MSCTEINGDHQILNKHHAPLQACNVVGCRRSHTVQHNSSTAVGVRHDRLFSHRNRNARRKDALLHSTYNCHAAVRSIQYLQNAFSKPASHGMSCVITAVANALHERFHMTCINIANRYEFGDLIGVDEHPSVVLFTVIVERSFHGEQR